VSEPAPLRALVVDDEPPLVRLVTSYLERDGFQVQAAVTAPGTGSLFQATP
jgi:CheY-like chemotaxis protein